jgi:hypothetical protein
MAYKAKVMSFKAKRSKTFAEKLKILSRASKNYSRNLKLSVNSVCTMNAN